MSIRAFLAIDLNADIRDVLDRFQGQADSVLPVKWVSPNSMHLTIKFLGEIQEEQVSVIQEVLHGVVKDISPFSLTIKGIGGFPSLQRPRILWAGVAHEVDHLEVLVSCVESALSTVGFPQEDRPYHPHLTLARIKTNPRVIGKIIESSDLLNKEWVFGDMVVDRLCLFQSQLTPKGAIYSHVWGLHLGV